MLPRSLSSNWVSNGQMREKFDEFTRTGFSGPNTCCTVLSSDGFSVRPVKIARYTVDRCKSLHNYPSKGVRTSAGRVANVCDKFSLVCQKRSRWVLLTGALVVT